MGEYDFYVDSEALINLKSEISSKIGVVQSSLASMESAVTAMGGQDGWVSDVYNTRSFPGWFPQFTVQVTICPIHIL